MLIWSIELPTCFPPWFKICRFLSSVFCILPLQLASFFFGKIPENHHFSHNLFISKNLRYFTQFNIGFVLHFFLNSDSCLLSSAVTNWLRFTFFYHGVVSRSRVNRRQTSTSLVEPCPRLTIILSSVFRLLSSDVEIGFVFLSRRSHRRSRISRIYLSKKNLYLPCGKLALFFQIRLNHPL